MKAIPRGVATRQQILDAARLKVRQLLTQSAAFCALPEAERREIATDTVAVVKALIEPEGLAGTVQATRNDPYAFAQAGRGGDGGRKSGEFKAQAAREGAAVAGALLREVNFSAFVSGLIDGVFNSIVTSSIKQMEAYGQLVKSVAQSLNQFRDENTTANQGRDHLVDQFSDTFMLDVDTGENGARPRVRLRDGVDEDAALRKVNSLPIEGGPLKSLDLDDDEVEEKVVQGARTQLATSRQQLLATMVLMGINRIVVTDGKIAAKVMYDFRAQDKMQASASSFDYENVGTRTVSDADVESDYQGADYSGSYESGKGQYEGHGAKYYSKGLYKTTSEPIVKISSATAETTDAALQTKAQLAGSVEVNFKSDYFPLEKMADSFQIGMIQNASKPGSSAAVAPRDAAPAASTPTPAATQPAPAA